MSGHIHLTLWFDDAAGVGDERPPLSPVGADIYEAFRPFAHEDREHGWPLLHLSEAIARMWQPTSTLIHDSDEGPGWSAALDPDRAPAWVLAWLGQWVGELGIRQLPESEQRARIRRRDQQRRGTPAAIRAAVEPFVDDPRAVTLRERFDAAQGVGVDAPYHLQVRVRRSALLPGVDEEEMRARVLARVPAGLICDVVITDEADYHEVADTFSDYDALRAGVSDYDDLLGG